MVVVGLAALLLLGAFTASMLSRAALDELAVLYTVPVVLAGLELGAAGGIAGAGVSFGLLLVASGRHSELRTLGLVACAVVFLLAGAFAGRFSTRMYAAQRRQQGLFDSGLRLARLDALEGLPRLLVDELWSMLELSCVRVALEDVPAAEVGAPGGERLLVPIETRGINFGTLTVFAPAGRTLAPEDKVVARQVALQAAVAADNQRLLAAERERAALHAELDQTRERLASHLREVSSILDSEEAERREAARQLHEGAAQDMAALLLELHVLARDLDQELSRQQVEEARAIAHDTLVGLRQLALDLRPSSLDERGLQAALEGIVEREQATRSRRITLDYGCGCGLAPDVETSAYRLVEDAIRASTGPITVQLKCGDGGEKLRINIRAQAGGGTRQLLGKLAGSRARIVLSGGTLQSNFDGSTTIVAELPCAAGTAQEPQ